MDSPSVQLYRPSPARDTRPIYSTPYRLYNIANKAKVYTTTSRLFGACLRDVAKCRVRQACIARTHLYLFKYIWHSQKKRKNKMCETLFIIITLCEYRMWI